MAALPDWHGRALLLSKSLIPDISTGLKLKNFSGLCWMCVLSGPVCMCSLSPCHFPCLLLNVLISQSVSFQFLLRAQPSLTLVFFFLPQGPSLFCCIPLPTIYCTRHLYIYSPSAISHPMVLTTPFYGFQPKIQILPLFPV